MPSAFRETLISQIPALRLLMAQGYEYLTPAEALALQGARVIGISALLTTTMPGMKAAVEALKESGMHGQIKLMIGGAPVTQKYADEIGADGYARDAAGAARPVALRTRW